MNKKLIAIVLLSLITLSVFSGCDSNKDANHLAETDESFRDEARQMEKSEQKKDYYDGAVSMSTANTTALDMGNDADSNSQYAKNNTITATNSVSTNTTAQSITNTILSERKIIRNAYISVEVNDFDKAYGEIKHIIGVNGFIQETNIKKHKRKVNDIERLVTTGNIIIRINKDNFDQILTGLNSLGLVVDERISSDDVTDRFFDSESRLRLLRYEQTRLEEYLKKISEPETIFKTEARLTNIRHEIEQLTGTLNKLSNFVKLSTITINISEKLEVEEVEPSYWTDVLDTFKESFKETITMFGNIVIVIIEAIPLVIVIGTLYFIAKPIYRKLRKKKKSKNDIEDDNNSE